MVWRTDDLLRDLSLFRQRLEEAGITDPTQLAKIGATLEEFLKGPIIDPPDPPEPFSCRNGYQAGVELWEGWCQNSRVKFDTIVADMIMLQTGKGVSALSDAELGEGTYRISFYFDGERIAQGGGGKHLVQLASSHVGAGDPQLGDGYANWLRHDFQPVNNTLHVHTYNADSAGMGWFPKGDSFDIVCDIWRTGLPIQVQTWHELEVSWHRERDDEMLLTATLDGITAPARIIRIHPESKDLKYAVVGNMDELELFGGNACIRFRRG